MAYSLQWIENMKACQILPCEGKRVLNRRTE